MFINKFLIRLSRGSGKQIALTCLIESVLTMISTLSALLIAYAVCILIGGIHIWFFTHISQLFICVFFLLILKFFFSQKKAIIASKCGIQIKDNLRNKMIQKLFQLGPGYTSRKRTGDITTSIFSKVECLNQYYSVYLPTAVASIINAVIIIVAIFRFDWLTACVCIIAFLGVLGCPMIFYNLMKELGKKEWEAHAKYYSDCLDSTQGITSLKAFNASDRQKKKIHEEGEDLRIKVMQQLKVTMLENGVLEFFARLGSAFSIAVAAIRCASGYLEPEMLIYNLFLIGACFTPMLSLISSWHLGYRGVSGAFSIYELLNEPVKLSLYFDNSESIDSNEALKDKIKQFNGDISFDNVSFDYKETEGNVISHVSFRIPNKTMTALVGPSGGGKSTLAHLLAGFYLVGEGSIQVGEYVLSEKTVDKIQSLITVVWQDSHIFYGTVFENILMGNSNATYDEVIEAAKKANIHDFIISLPEGYDTNLGEGGIRFSGGERQRIAIARAFLKDSPIIIFDEATSSLDRKNEIEIQKSFNDLSQGKTVLVIAHRLSTIQNANQICIIEEGNVKSFGTHEELIRSSGLYRKLIGNQLEQRNRDIAITNCNN